MVFSLQRSHHRIDADEMLLLCCGAPLRQPELRIPSGDAMARQLAMARQVALQECKELHRKGEVGRKVLHLACR